MNDIWKIVVRFIGNLVVNKTVEVDVTIPLGPPKTIEDAETSKETEQHPEKLFKGNDLAMLKNGRPVRVISVESDYYLILDLLNPLCFYRVSMCDLLELHELDRIIMLSSKF